MKPDWTAANAALCVALSVEPDSVSHHFIAGRKCNCGKAWSAVSDSLDPCPLGPIYPGLTRLDLLTAALRAKEGATFIWEKDSCRVWREGVPGLVSSNLRYCALDEPLGECAFRAACAAFGIEVENG